MPNAVCVSKSWNQACHRILSKPKLASAFSLDPDEKGLLGVLRRTKNDHIFSVKYLS
ncbi:hypothetical protein NC651_028952 [Populus alba x Populus x berolinensis]|nr:hypothetical protein NC651_028952 [Populus alba x Populus x berolinensis]